MLLVIFFLQKIKDVHCSDRNSRIPEFLFVRFLVFELLSILYFTVANDDLGFRRLAGKQRSLALQNMPLTLSCSV